MCTPNSVLVRAADANGISALSYKFHQFSSGLMSAFCSVSDTVMNTDVDFFSNPSFLLNINKNLWAKNTVQSDKMAKL